MGKNNGFGETVIIKKYANRRLYDTSTSSYVTLDHLSDLVKREVPFEVRDAKTGEDLTRAVLTQIIFEQETKGQGALPTNFLRQLIKFYGDGVQSALPAWLDMSMNAFADRQEKWRSTIGKAFPMTPVGFFEEQAKRNMVMFEQALKMAVPGAKGKTGPTKADGKGETSHREPEIDFTDPMSVMQAQMAAMQAQLDFLTKKTDD
ncbi:MAG: polyhydroxyalkanoate synthesis repressor PhaR [Pseudomonadota bacterium]